MKQPIQLRTLRFIPLFFIIVLTLLSCSFDSKEETVSGGFYFDTYITLTILDNNISETIKTEAINACFEQCAYYESLFSKTVSGSDIDCINQSNQEWVSVSSDTITLLQEALNYAQITDGKIDPTINSVAELWDFHDTQSPTLPDDEALFNAISHVDYTQIHIQNQQVKLSDSHASIDLGFIAKGFIGDRLKDTLCSYGIQHAIINLGGNVVLVGSKPDSTDYQVAIERPFGKGSNDAIAVISVSDTSVVTSGVYERYFYLNGIRYHHILDTSTGYPLENGLTSVTIICDSSLSADALSTTCFVLGLEDGMALIESMDGVEAMFIDDQEQIHTSSGFPAYH